MINRITFTVIRVLLIRLGVSPEGAPSLWVLLNKQSTGTAQAGNYADTLILIVTSNPQL